MAGRSSDDTVSPMPPISPGGVLMVAFVAPKSYAATSYPHPIKEAKAANPDETRDIALSKNIPSSLLKCIESLKGHEQLSKNPSTTRYYTLKPGCFFMHITCWRPKPPEEGDYDYVPFEETKEALWLAYSWTDRASHQWLPDKNPTFPQNSHPTLGKYLRDIHTGAPRGGNPSHFAIGDTSESFFIRLSDDDRNWHYRYHGLPEDCDLAIQKSMAASRLYKDPKDRCPHNLQHWTFGRLRAVTLGQGGGWILYREEQSEVLFGGRHLPPRLKKALEDGQTRGLVINQAVLNPHHAREYVLAYNDGSVYYAFHESFQKDFDRIGLEWCGDKIDYKPHADLLTDKDYPHVLISDEPEPERAPAPRPAQQREPYRSARQNPRPRTPPTVMNSRQTAPNHDLHDPGHARSNSEYSLPVRGPPLPGYGPTYAPAYGQTWGPAYGPAWGPPAMYGPPPGPPQPAPATFLYDPYTGQQLYSEMGDQGSDSELRPQPPRNQAQTRHSSVTHNSRRQEGPPPPQGGSRSRWRPWGHRDES